MKSNRDLIFLHLGFGTCVEGRCVCNPGYSGTGIWFDLSSTDCNINNTALDVLNYIAYATFIIFTLAVIYRLFIFGPLRIVAYCRADFELPQDKFIVPAQRVLVMLLLVALGTPTCSTRIFMMCKVNIFIFY